jgi:hypothetical protein
MKTKDEILTHPDIAQFVATHQGTRNEIERAAGALAGKPDAIAALVKLFPALTQRVVRIFFSFKHKDTVAAQTIVQSLREPGGRNLKITYMGDFTKEIAGKKWREHILEAVSEANWFLLLLPDPSEDWDWCLYETGLFEARLTSADRLICLHHPDISLPEPIRDYQHVAAVPSEVEKLLRRLYVEDDPVYGLEAINPMVEGRLPEIAQQIVDAIVPPRKTLFRDIFEPWVELKIPGAGVLTGPEDLDEARVVTANKSALDLFDFVVPPKTFGELRSGLPKPTTGDSRWLVELFHVVRRIANGRKFFPIQAVFQKWDGKMYRPVLCAVDRKERSGPIETFHVTFTEEVGHVDDSAIPRHVSELATILRFAFRFRWEVLAKFAGKPLAEEDVTRVENALKRIKKDWESRGISADDSFARLFSPEKAKRVAEILLYWRKKKNDEGTGELDIAIRERDAAAVSSILEEFVPFNQEFVEMAAERFSEQATGNWQ